MPVSETGGSNKLFRLVGRHAGASPVFFPPQVPITYSLHPIVSGEPLQTNLWCFTPDFLATGLVPSGTQGVTRRVHRYALNPIRHTLHKKPFSLVACPWPEGSESVLASIADDCPDHHQTVWTLPVSKMVLPVNSTISETSEEASVLLLPCGQEPCVAWDYGGRMSVLDLAEMTLPGESGNAERENRKVRKVVQTRDQDGNIVYQWYDQDGHLHTISEWDYKRRLSLYFQSWLEFLYPEYFGSSIPAGGGWHQWQYWKVRRTADRPENTDPQQWPDRQARHQPDGKTASYVAAVQPIPEDRSTKYQSRHQSSQPQPSPSGRDIGRTDENEIDRLLMEFESGHIQEIAARHNENYDGREHGQYCSQIKNATRIRREPLTDDEKPGFVPFMRHLSEVIHSFNGINLSICIHSLVASELLYPPHSTQGSGASLDGEGGSVKKAQKGFDRRVYKGG